ncbi:hypothetical protein, partial [Staphylococcus epidermidis]|uniref:hypothetical protein n=1 Tax=Staphylococcus epidermidis TaxID=1282 RepID=UPI001C931C1B
QPTGAVSALQPLPPITFNHSHIFLTPHQIKQQFKPLLNIIQHQQIKSNILQTHNPIHFYFKPYNITNNKTNNFSPISIIYHYNLPIKNTSH